MEACIRSTLNFRSILDTPYVNGIAIRDFGKDFWQRRRLTPDAKDGRLGGNSSYGILVNS